MGKSEKWHETRNKREQELFEGKHFKVVSEIKAAEGEKFTSPLGYKLKSGYEVVQVTEDGGPTRALPFVVGKATLKRMAEVYNAVELPAPKKRGRPKKSEQVTVDEVPEQDAKDVPAQSGSQAGPTYDNPNE